MFPNVRLLVGALFASVVALSCGFGLFAAFRVNHEPLSRLPVGTSPVQFVANEVAGRAGWGTPFDGQSRLNGPQRGEIAADASAVTPAGQASVESASTGTAAAIKPVAAATPVIETAAPSAIAQPAVVIEPAVTATTARRGAGAACFGIRRANLSDGSSQRRGEANGAGSRGLNCCGCAGGRRGPFGKCCTRPNSERAVTVDRCPFGVG